MQFIIIAAVLIIGASVMWFLGTGETETTTDENSRQMTEEVTTVDEVVAADEALPPSEEDTIDSADNTYINGTYNADGVYVSPAGEEHIEISLVLENDVVTAATFEGHATNPGSVTNQKKFSDGFEAAVVGKSLDEISLTVVNGSSLTPIGFMNALSKIKIDAQS